MIQALANEICRFLKQQSEIKGCRFCGSLANGTADAFSDIDIEIDVSGIDNGIYATRLPEIISARYPVIYYDFAPSLAPEKYVVSVAVHEGNPFMTVDISCTASPHYATVSKAQLMQLNQLYDHILKLFTINLKHSLRGADCGNDIRRMYHRAFPADTGVYSDCQMLVAVYGWLEQNAESRHETYLSLLGKYI